MDSVDCLDDALPPDQPERRAPRTCPYIALVEQRLSHGNERMDRMETALHENNAATAELLDIMRMAKSGFRMIGALGALIKWGAAILAPVLAAWFAWKNGVGKP